jgi:hyperosmotically inducible periplasmic protein
MRTLLRLIVVVALILGVVWLIQNRKAPSRQDVRAGVDSVVRETKEAVHDLDKKLDVPEISEELKRTGRIVRRKARQAADKLADATEGAETTAAIKAKLALDPNLSAIDISVNTTYGRVTLAGRADSEEDIARAIRIALERDEVREVVSTIQVRSPEDAKKVRSPEDAKKVNLVR